MSDYASRREAEAVEAVDRSLAQRVVRLVSVRNEGREVDLAPYLQALPPLTKLVSIGAERFRDQVFDELNTAEPMTGARTPWAKVNEIFRMRPGEVTAWIGPNNEGKSTAVLQVMGTLALAGERCFVASLEMPVKEQILIICRQQLVHDFGNRPRYDRLMDRLDEQITFFDDRGAMAPQTALALTRYACRELGSQHVVIDNLTKVVPPSLDSDRRLAQFIGTATLLASTEGCHLTLVGHVRKPERGKVITRYDWRGTGAASDMVDNVITVQENPKKKPSVDGRDDITDDSYDTLLCVDKQRYGPARKRFRFWFNEEQRRLSPGRGYAMPAFDDEALF